MPNKKFDAKQFSAFIKEFYTAPPNKFVVVDVPKTRYLVIDGKGNPEQQDFPGIIKWFYSVVHAAKPFTQKAMGKHFGYPPTEFQFWAKNSKDFVDGNKSKWLWRVLVLCGDFMPKAVIDDAMAQVAQRLGPPPSPAKLKFLNEGKCVQYLHVGDYSGVAKVCEKLYGQYLPANKLTPSGYYHEIYLNDPTRAMPKKRKILIRQPVE